MTTEQFEKLMAFIGRVKVGADMYQNPDGTMRTPYTNPPTSLTNDEACELLDALAERGYGYSLHNSQKIHRLVITTNSICVSSDWHPTIPKAVANAVLKLIEKEGR